MVQATKKIALLHRFPEDRIRETNAAFPYLRAKGIDVLTFKEFDRLNSWNKFWKSLAWIFYAPCLVFGKDYDVIYCDDSFPFYPALVKLVSPRSRVVIRLGDLHLMYYTSGWVYQFLHFFEKIAWEAVDKIIVISEAMAIYVSSDIRRPVEVVLDPVDPKDFEVPNLSTDANIVCFHGVITKNKNIDLLIEAAKRLPEIVFYVLGDGPDLKRLKSIASENVRFTGWRHFSEVKNFIAVSKIGLALRSNNDGNEYVVTSPFLQYGVMGKPCLVTRRRVFGDYEWQFSGVDELVEKIKILLDKPEEGEKLREYILKNHNAKDIAEQIWQILT